MNAKLDNDTIATAADPVLRRTAIASLAKHYRKLCWVSGVMLLGLVSVFIFSSKPPTVAVFVVVIWPLVQLYRCESDLRWLRVIDQIQSNEKVMA